ncbi:S41 family peptidase [Butyrivibrio sp. AE2032]|uniref:S41 family peptidase n=1 Tax=Butyrivibrio sp. AE2032 TaxID=1458463 RepID=UPI00054FEF6B|nr:S41 family peptidase [Butyrivibrio sp. AE2032]
MKKRFVLLMPVTWLVFIALYFIDRRLMAVPLAASIIVSLAILMINAFIVIKVSSGKGLKITMSVLSLLAVLIYSLAGIVCNPYWNSITGYANRPYADSYENTVTSKEAIEDLDYMMRFLKKDHPALLNGMPQEVEDRYKTVRSELESIDTITVNELCRKTEYVLNCLHDGHTYTFPKYDFHYLKDCFSEELAGYKTTSVNGLTIDELAEQSRDIISYEAESWEISRIRSLYFTLEGLDFLGLDNTEVTYVFEKDGDKTTRTYTQEDYALLDEIEMKTEDTATESFVSYEIDEENSLAIMTLTECNANAEYNKAVRDMFTEVKEKNIQHVAVDIRGNGGGNDAVISEFFRYLDIDEYKTCGLEWRLGFFTVPYPARSVKNEKADELLFKGDFYLLTSSGTFSSGMLYAQYVKDNHIGTIIGEAPGNDPNGYGEVVFFSLPNSKIFMSVSTKHFVRADANAGTYLVEPDISCDYSEAKERLYEAIG